MTSLGPKDIVGPSGNLIRLPSDINRRPGDHIGSACNIMWPQNDLIGDLFGALTVLIGSIGDLIGLQSHLIESLRDSIGPPRDPIA